MLNSQMGSCNVMVYGKTLFLGYCGIRCPAAWCVESDIAKKHGKNVA